MILNVTSDSQVWVAEFQPNITRFTLAIIEDVKKELRSVIDTPQVRLVLNLDNIDFMDSSAIGCILSLIKTAEKQNGRVLICNASPRIIELFRMLHLVHLSHSDRTLKQAETEILQ